MDDLITWLRACLDEDERVAREAAGAPWVAEIPGAVHVDAAAIAENRAWRNFGFVASVEHDADRQHLARWDPARVLAEIAAKRRILDLHAFGGTPPLSAADECRECVSDFPCPTVRLLALPYADRPGYRPEWAPGAPQSDREPQSGGIGYAGGAQGHSGGDCMVVAAISGYHHDCRCVRGTVEHWEHRCHCGAKFWARGADTTGPSTPAQEAP